MVRSRYHDRIREIRNALNLSQSVMAERIGVMTRFYNRLENGKSSPSIETLLSTLDGLKMSASDFFQDNSESRSVPIPIAQMKEIRDAIRDEMRFKSRLTSPVVHDSQVSYRDVIERLKSMKHHEVHPILRMLGLEPEADPELSTPVAQLQPKSRSPKS